MGTRVVYFHSLKAVASSLLSKFQFLDWRLKSGKRTRGPDQKAALDLTWIGASDLLVDGREIKRQTAQVLAVTHSAIVRTIASIARDKIVASIQMSLALLGRRKKRHAEVRAQYCA